MSNQPIEEKWKEELASHKLESDEGTVIPLYVAEDFIENLLEQERMKKGLEYFAILREEMEKERKRMSDEVEELEDIATGEHDSDSVSRLDVMSIINK